MLTALQAAVFLEEQSMSAKSRGSKSPKSWVIPTAKPPGAGISVSLPGSHGGLGYCHVSKWAVGRSGPLQPHWEEDSVRGEGPAMSACSPQTGLMGPPQECPTQ